jgi:orotidine-5'-phosphate decarboxylase
VALDGSPSQAVAWVKTLAPLGVRFKVGLELFYQLHGQLEILGLLPGTFFLDLKLHDIPNTVAGGLKALAHHRPALINMHCSAGAAALAAAARALEGCNPRPRLLGVTVLTSLSAGDLQALGFHEPPEALAVRLARLARDAGLDGVVCGGHEIELIKQACGGDFLAVVPGIRPAGAAAGDQQRTLTPGEAYARCADALVIGRPITGQTDPAEACKEILDNINK